VSAGRRPLLVVAGLWFLVRLVTALGVSAPVEATVGRALARTPAGESALSEPGGAVLVEVVRRLPEVGAATGAMGWLVALALVVSLVPWGATAIVLADPDAEATSALSRAVTRMPRLLLATGTGWILILVLLGLGGLAARQLGEAFDAGTEGRVLATAATGIFAALPAVVAGIFVDAMRAQGAVSSGAVYDDLGLALRVLRSSGLRLLARYYAAAVVAVAITLFAGFLGAAAVLRGGSFGVAIGAQVVAALALFGLRVWLLASVVGACGAERARRAALSRGQHPPRRAETGDALRTP
jgi:hypothetical protein